MPTRIVYLNHKIIGGKKYYKNVKYPEVPPSINDIYLITSIGDRLDLLAHEYYGDSDLWWIISIANPNVVRRDSWNLLPALEIRIPRDYESIIDEFEELNKK